MATMIPDIPTESIENHGERYFYSVARELPSSYTVLYSYKFCITDLEIGRDLREADFVIAHPELGYVVVEVKQNPIGFHNGAWHEFKGNKSFPLHKDPVEQATAAMYAILDRYKRLAHSDIFPLGIRYALCFPETRHITGVLPAQIKPESVWTQNNLDNLEATIVELFGRKRQADNQTYNVLINQVLAPNFRLYSTLEDQLAVFNRHSDKLLTTEQERILDETEEDRRKIFFGAAGTGKSFVAMEKARRLSAQGRKVLLTCYNRALVEMYRAEVPSPLVNACCFLDHLQELLQVPTPKTDLEQFYERHLPEQAFDYYSQLPETAKYDAIIVDEGQDFKESWFVSLDAMLKENGHFYVFADPKQDLFGHGLDTLRNMSISKHRLTLNLRNSAPICDYLSRLTGDKHKGKLDFGLPVCHITWKDAPAEKRLIEKEIGRLVSQGLRPERILILSPHRRENSSLAGLSKIKEWPLVDVAEKKHGIKFCTIRTFKGLEADVVFLIGVRPSKACTPADIYVGASRAKFLLYVFSQELEGAGYGEKDS